MELREALPRWRWRAADGAAIAGLLFLALYYLTSFRFHDLFTNDFREVDFIQWHRYPPIIAQYLQYPSVALDDWRRPFPYLPSAVALLMPLSKLPESVAFAGWIALQAVSLAIALWAGLKLSGGARLRARLLIALAAVLLTDNAIGWDFRTHNTNTAYLALIMAGLVVRSTWLSALLLGVSCNLKIYSGVLVGVFIWRREYRLAAGMLVATALIAVALPIAVFGFSGYVQLLGGWLDQALFFDPPPGRVATLPANLLRQSGALILGADPSSLAVSVLVHISQAIWIVLVLGYFLLAQRPTGRAGPGGRPVAGDAARARLCDVCVALLAPLPLSIWFTPYHAIVLLPANILLLTVALETGWDLRTRQVAVAALVGCQALQYLVGQWELRGAISLVSFALVVFALGCHRSPPGTRRNGTRRKTLAAQLGLD